MSLVLIPPTRPGPGREESGISRWVQDLYLKERKDRKDGEKRELDDTWEKVEVQG